MGKSIEAVAIIAIGFTLLCYGLIEAAAHGTSTVPLHVVVGIAGYLAVCCYVIFRINY